MTGRDAIRGVECHWASPRALLEPCARCGRVRVLLLARGRGGAPLLCVICVAADRSGELADVAEAAALTLFDDEGEAAR